jgi:TonB-dependent receptor
LDAGDLTRDTHDVTEDALAGYARLDFESAWANVPVRGNVGVRVVSTESTARLVTPSFTVSRTGDGVTGLTLDPLNGDTAQFEEFDNSYTNVLPSLNVVAQPKDDLQIRFAVAKAMTRPLYEDLGETLVIAGTEPGENIDEVVLIGRSGNPDLDPFEAWQYDLGFGWYPSRDFNVTATVWYKDVSNFIVNQANEVVFTDASGTAVPVTVNQPTNLDEDGYIAGIELSYFQNFRFLPGILQHTGVSANYAHLDTDIESSFAFTYTDGTGSTPNGIGCEVPDPTASGRICADVSQPPDGFAEDAANLIMFYDDGKLDVRLAARYKSDFPQQFLDFPRVANERTQLDANLGYAFNKSLRFVASVTNLTNEPIERTWQDPFNSGDAVGRQLYREFGRKVTVGFVGRL